MMADQEASKGQPSDKEMQKAAADPKAQQANPAGTSSTQDVTQVDLDDKADSVDDVKRSGTWYAHTDLKWGVDPVYTVDTGEKVNVGLMSDSEFDTFVEYGAILKVPRIDTMPEEATAELLAEKDQRIAELQAALADAKKGK
jgi:hypothetical protein